MSVSLEVWLEQVSRMANERAARVTDATPLDLASSLAAAFRGRGLRSLADVLSAGLDSNEAMKAVIPTGMRQRKLMVAALEATVQAAVAAGAATAPGQLLLAAAPSPVRAANASAIEGHWRRQHLTAINKEDAENAEPPAAPAAAAAAAGDDADAPPPKKKRMLAKWNENGNTPDAHPVLSGGRALLPGEALPTGQESQNGKTPDARPVLSGGRALLPGEVLPIGREPLYPGTRVDVLFTADDEHSRDGVFAGTVSPRVSSGATGFDVLFDTGKTFGIIPGQTRFAPRESSSFDMMLPQLDKGCEIDAQDRSGHWLQAKICENSGDTVRVHFMGWNSKHDETIPISTERLAHRGTRSALVLQQQQQQQQQLSPKAKAKVKQGALKPLAVSTSMLSEQQHARRKMPQLSLQPLETGSDDSAVSNGPSVCTPVGRIALGDCLLLKTSSSPKQDDLELCTVTSVSSTRGVQLRKPSGHTESISIDDMTEERVQVFPEEASAGGASAAASRMESSVQDSSSESDDDDAQISTSGLFIERDWSNLVPKR